MSKALDKLTVRLLDYGLSIADEDFQIAKGYWTHNHQDCIRWELNAHMAGAFLDEPTIGIDSWDTIGECAKYGFYLTRGSEAYGQYTAHAKFHGATPPDPKDVVTVEQFKEKHAKKG